MGTGLLLLVSHYDLLHIHGLERWRHLLLVPGSSETEGHVAAPPANPTASCYPLDLDRPQHVDRGMAEHVSVARFVVVYRSVGSCPADTLGSRHGLWMGQTSLVASSLHSPTLSYDNRS